jgi:hypothetical protein
LLLLLLRLLLLLQLRAAFFTLTLMVAFQLSSQLAFFLDLLLRGANCVPLSSGNGLFGAHGVFDEIVHVDSGRLLALSRVVVGQRLDDGEVVVSLDGVQQRGALLHARLDRGQEATALLDHTLQRREPLLLVVATNGEQLALGVVELLRLQYAHLVAQLDAV